jgi:hypothetical protein
MTMEMVLRRMKVEDGAVHGFLASAVIVSIAVLPATLKEATALWGFG